MGTLPLAAPPPASVTQPTELSIKQILNHCNSHKAQFSLNFQGYEQPTVQSAQYRKREIFLSIQMQVISFF